MKKHLRLLTIAACAAFLMIATAATASASELSDSIVSHNTTGAKVLSGDSSFRGSASGDYLVQSSTGYSDKVVLKWAYTPYPASTYDLETGTSYGDFLGFAIYEGRDAFVNGDWIDVVYPSEKTSGGYYTTTLKTVNPGFYKSEIIVEAVYDSYSWEAAATIVNTLPDKVSTDDFGIDKIGRYSYFAVNRASGVSGTQLQMYTVSPSKLKKTVSTSGSEFKRVRVSKNVTYKFRVRSYFKNPDNGVTYYGPWSKFRYFDNIHASYTVSPYEKGCKIKIKGAKGVVAYKVYVSTKKNSRGKLVKTCKVKAGKSKIFTINKCAGKYMKKGKTYYVRAYPIIKSGGKKYTSCVYARVHFKSKK